MSVSLLVGIYTDISLSWIVKLRICQHHPKQLINNDNDATEMARLERQRKARVMASVDLESICMLAKKC